MTRSQQEGGSRARYQYYQYHINSICDKPISNTVSTIHITDNFTANICIALNADKAIQMIAFYSHTLQTRAGFILYSSRLEASNFHSNKNQKEKEDKKAWQCQLNNAQHYYPAWVPVENRFWVTCQQKPSLHSCPCQRIFTASPPLPC